MIAVSIVIPTYNRARHLASVVEQLSAYLSEQHWVYEIILVDDASPDETGRMIRTLTGSHSNIKGILLEHNIGQQNATLAGIRQAKYPWVLTMDDDLEHDLPAIKTIVSHLESGYDVVYVVNAGDRPVWFRKIGTLIKEEAFRFFCNKPKDLQLTSYRGMNRRIADFVANDENRHVYISARILQADAAIATVKTDCRFEKRLKTNYRLKKLIFPVLQTVLHYGIIPDFKNHWSNWFKKVIGQKETTEKPDHPATGPGKRNKKSDQHAMGLDGRNEKINQSAIGPNGRSEKPDQHAIGPNGRSEKPDQHARQPNRQNENTTALKRQYDAYGQYRIKEKYNCD